MMKRSIHLTSILFCSLLLFIVVRSQTTSRATPRTTPRTTPRPRQCGTPSVPPSLSNARIVGGVPARPHSWPWQISFQIDGRHYCGGSIINETLVITAAHCIRTNVSLDRFTVSAGDDDLRIVSDGPTQKIKIKKIIVNENYRPQNAYINDIALLILATPLVFNQNISAVCLPKEPVVSEQNSYATGWGSTKNVSISSAKLNQARLPIFSLSECRNLKGYFANLHENQLCAGYVRGGKNVFSGDSGGPLVLMKADKKWYLHGIASWVVAGKSGNKAGKIENLPGCFTRVFNFVSWIAAKTGFTG